MNHAFHDMKFENEIEVISCSRTFDQNDSQKWLRCPAGCRNLGYDVIGGDNGFYSGKSHICKSAIHAGVVSGNIYSNSDYNFTVTLDNGGLLKTIPHVSPLSHRSIESFSASMSNSISSISGSGRASGTGAFSFRKFEKFEQNTNEHEQTCFDAEIQNFNTSQITASSYLEEFTEISTDGNAFIHL